jgi:signal recognition particle GTPase
VPGPQQVRKQEQHEEKLKDMNEQVAKGKLVIRQMTEDERERFPPREPNSARKGSGRRS